MLLGYLIVSLEPVQRIALHIVQPTFDECLSQRKLHNTCALLLLFLQSLLLLTFATRLPSHGPQIRWLFDAKFMPQVIHIPLQLLLPVHIDNLLAP